MNTRRIFWLAIMGIVLSCTVFVACLPGSSKNQSPKDTASYASEQLNISVDYCRPYKKGRLIFGHAADGALQPYGEYWRMGANEATEINLDQDVNFGGQDLAKGRYVLYAVPGESSWTIGLNSELGRWGAFEVDHDKDVMQVEVSPENGVSETEQFEITFSEADDSSVHMNLMWDQVKVAVPIMRQ